jgi:DNA (cytosine-5)-methyltransferase 1
MSFRYVDLFAGIGGFHAALGSLGGECVYAVEIDAQAAAVYQRNWGMNPIGDITIDVSDKRVKIPDHDVLVAGFPCQPFSKSGLQKGMEETRGTLYWSILQIIKKRKPPIVLLENVRNLAGPRHEHEWRTIVETLRAQKYRICDTPTIFSPHLLPPDSGGRPQFRERVFIAAVRDTSRNANLVADAPVVNNRPVHGWNPQSWNLDKHLLLKSIPNIPECRISEGELLWINAWDDFVVTMRALKHGERLPGFPFWVDAWKPKSKLRIPKVMPAWKANILRKNASFYDEHRVFLDQWIEKWGVNTDAFPTSRRKFEWQAQDTQSLWETVMQLRPSGIRAKQATYLPALVAITQTSIIGPQRRRLSPREATRLQGFPDWFDFSDQPHSATYRQLGNSVNVGAVCHVFREIVQQNLELLRQTAPAVVRAVEKTPVNPDTTLRKHKSHKKTIWR